jgi:hypothetical protein
MDANLNRRLTWSRVSHYQLTSSRTTVQLNFAAPRRLLKHSREEPAHAQVRRSDRNVADWVHARHEASPRIVHHSHSVPARDLKSGLQGHGIAQSETGSGSTMASGMGGIEFRDPRNSMLIIEKNGLGSPGTVP